jgi:hypothetical protein
MESTISMFCEKSVVEIAAGVICGARTACHSKASEFTSVLSGVRVIKSLIYCYSVL